MYMRFIIEIKYEPSLLRVIFNFELIILISKFYFSKQISIHNLSPIVTIEIPCCTNKFYQLRTYNKETPCLVIQCG